jgi:hypothetical protein
LLRIGPSDDLTSTGRVLQEIDGMRRHALRRGATGVAHRSRPLTGDLHLYRDDRTLRKSRNCSQTPRHDCVNALQRLDFTALATLLGDDLPMYPQQHQKNPRKA